MEHINLYSISSKTQYRNLQYYYTNNNTSQPITIPIMKEVIIFPGPRAEIIDSPIPKPTADQIVIKVVVSGSNPKDWKVDWLPEGLNQGDDIAGIVHEVGANITEFKVRQIINIPRIYPPTYSMIAR